MYRDQCWGHAEIDLLSQDFQGCIIRGLSVCTNQPHRYDNCVAGPPLFNVAIREGCRGCYKRQIIV